MNNRQENIAAAAALSKIAEIKQFGLLESYDYLLQNKYVVALNEQAKAVTGIDIINSKKLSFDDVDIYEDFLDDFIQDSIILKVDDSFLQEELKMLDSVEDLQIDYFKTINFKTDFVSKAIKTMFKSIGVTVPSILPIMKDPIRVQLTKGISDEYFTVSKFELKSKIVYVLFHIGTGAFTETATEFTFSSIDKQMRSGNYVQGKDAHGSSCFFFTEQSAKDIEPFYLFFTALARYAKNVTVGGITKKFFHRGFSSKLMNTNDIIINSGLVGVRGITSGHISTRHTNLGYEYSNLYLLDAEKMLDDYSKRKFI